MFDQLAFATTYTTPDNTILSLLYLAFVILTIVAMGKLFMKADLPGWGCIVPFYNAYLLFKMTWGNGWIFLLALIPFVNLIILALTMWKLSLAFGRGFVFTLGLLLVTPLFMIILGFNGDEYRGVPGKTNRLF